MPTITHNIQSTPEEAQPHFDPITHVKVPRPDNDKHSPCVLVTTPEVATIIRRLVNKHTNDHADVSDDPVAEELMRVGAFVNWEWVR